MDSPPSISFTENKKTSLERKVFPQKVTNHDLSRHIVDYVYAVGTIFEEVTFKQTELSHCYFRNCRFIRCDFTGVIVKDSNFRGSVFRGCDFRYSHWEKTFLDLEFLHSCLPCEENLARDLVRTLRVNYSQIGNYDAVNEAASIEVKLTGEHHFKAAYSWQSYYREKYKGFSRLSHAFQHAKWKFLDLLWGNGESLTRVVLTGVAITALATLYSKITVPSAPAIQLVSMCVLAFWGISKPALPDEITLALTVSRFLLFGLFMAILIKRLSKR